MANPLYKKQVIIGGCAILAVLILVFGIDYLKGINLFKPANYYYVSYTDVQGLSVSAPVTVNGFKVGQVRDIQYEYDNPGHVLVELSLNRDLKVPRGTKAILKADLLGTASIHLVMPSHNDMHEIGEQIIGETDQGMFASVGDKVMPAVGEILVKVDTLLASLNTIVSDPAIATALGRLDGITYGVEGTINNVDLTVRDINGAVKTLNQAISTLPPTMDNVNHASANVEKMSENLLTVSQDLKDLPVKQFMDNLNTTSQNIKSLSQELNNPNSTLGLLLRDKGLYNNVNNTISSLDSLLVDIKANPKRYISIKLF